MINLHQFTYAIFSNRFVHKFQLNLLNLRRTHFSKICLIHLVYLILQSKPLFILFIQVVEKTIASMETQVVNSKKTSALLAWLMTLTLL